MRSLICVALLVCSLIPASIAESADTVIFNGDSLIVAPAKPTNDTRDAFVSNGYGAGIYAFGTDAGLVAPVISVGIGSNGGELAVGRVSGITAAPTRVLANETIGTVNAAGFDGTFVQAATALTLKAKQDWDLGTNLILIMGHQGDSVYIPAMIFQGQASGKRVVCVDSLGRLFASSTGTGCDN